MISGCTRFSRNTGGDFPCIALASLFAVLAVAGCGAGEPDRKPGRAGEATARLLQGKASDGLVFARVVGATSDLARARLSDGAVRPLLETPDRQETWPYWSDAAGRLVFQVAGGRMEKGVPRLSDLIFWDPEGGTETPLVSTARRDERWPSWSPDGRSVVFAFRGSRSRAGIARYDVASGEVSLLKPAPKGRALLRPIFSPDGALLSLEQRTPGAASSLLRILSLTGDVELRPLTTDPRWLDSKGFFSRDGETIFFTRRRAGDASPRRIFRIPTAGGEARPLFDSAEFDEHSARPSPVRDEVIFVSDRAAGEREADRSDVHLAAFDGSQRRLLTHTPLWNEYAPRWSPDGERIVVIAVPAGSGPPRFSEPSRLAEIRLRVLDREGNLLFDAPGMMADWMPAWP